MSLRHQYGIRKLKTGVGSILLSTAVLSLVTVNQSVSAQEDVQEDPSTSLAESVEDTEILSQSEESLVSEVEYINQEESVQSVAEQQTENNDKLEESASSFRDEVKSVNDDVDSAVSQYPDAKIEEKVLTVNSTDAESYKSQQDEAVKIKESNQKAIDTYLKDKERIDEENKATKEREDKIKREASYSDEKSGIYVTGDFNKDKDGVAFYEGVKVTSFGKDTVGVTSLYYGDNTVIESPQNMKVTEMDETDSVNSLKYRLTELKKGSTFVLRNMGETEDGRAIHANVTVAHADEYADSPIPPYVLVGQGVKDKTFTFHYLNYSKLGFDFAFVDDDGNPLQLLVASIVGDVDFGQASKVEFKGNTLNVINPEGSQLTETEDGLLAGENLNASGFNSAPVGSYLAVGASDVMTYTHTSSKSSSGSDSVNSQVQFDLFGQVSFVNSEEFPYLAEPSLTLTRVVAVENPMTSFTDEDGKVLIPNEDGLVPPKEIDGYVFVSTKPDGENQIHVYKPKPVDPVTNPTTSFVDEDGKVLIPNEDGLVPPKEIDGYVFVSTKPDGENQIHVYKPKPVDPITNPTTSFVDEDGKVLIPNEDGLVPPKEIDGYVFVSTKPDGENQIHVYKPKPVDPVTNPITSFVDEDGKVLIPNEDGLVPPKEIDGYVFVSTKPDGENQIHVYKPKPKEEPQKPELPKPQDPQQVTKAPKTEVKAPQSATLPQTGESLGWFIPQVLSVLAGLGLVSKRKEENE